MIPFNKPAITGLEHAYMAEACESGHLSGDGSFTRRCGEWLENHTKTLRALLTTSCTHALEMCAMLINLKPGDEVIMPSYTFVSTANAFVLRGAKVVFVDIRPDTMNIDETLIEQAISSKTKAIVAVHYAGVACEMDKIMEIANKHELFVIEDAAQAITSEYKGKALGAIGHLGCYSFHETKNLQCGEGGALLINDLRFIERAEIIREKGTNRSRFFRGEVDKYTWVEPGSSFLLSDLNAAFLYAQLQNAEEIKKNRIDSWEHYRDSLAGLEESNHLELPETRAIEAHNAHMFQIKVKDLATRSALLSYLKEKNIMAVFHYVPLHSSEAGKRLGVFLGKDKYTTIESERLVRLPLYYNMNIQEINFIVRCIKEFFSNHLR